MPCSAKRRLYRTAWTHRDRLTKRESPADSGASRRGRAGCRLWLAARVLSPLETLAQSISTIAPTATPVATIPLVCALAGNATWLAYVLATIAIMLVAWCVGALPDIPRRPDRSIPT